jgi:hypothetical protein
MTKSAAFLTICHLSEDACSPHERSDMRDRPGCRQRPRDRQLIRATGGRLFPYAMALPARGRGSAPHRLRGLKLS